MAWSIDPEGLAEQVADECASYDGFPDAATTEGRRAIFERAFDGSRSFDRDFGDEQRKWFEAWIRMEIDGPGLRALVGNTNMGNLYPPRS